MTERIIAVDRIENIISVFGSFDQNVRLIESELNVTVTDRDSELRISGEAENVLQAEKAVNGLLALAAKGETTILNAESVDRGYEAVERELTALGAAIRRL